MKSIKYLFSALLIVTCLMAEAGDKAFKKAMNKGLEMLDNANGREDLQNTANMFDRIAEKETKEWLPLYYSGLSYIYLSFSDSLSLEQRDTYLVKAKERATKAAEISEENVEIIILQGYITMAKLSADPSTRGPSLSPVIMQTFGKAVQMAPENPRALVMMARMEYGMAQFFGSGTEKACGMAKKSLEYFKDKEEGDINPSWGKGMATQMVQSCNRAESNE